MNEFISGLGKIRPTVAQGVGNFDTAGRRDGAVAAVASVQPCGTGSGLEGRPVSVDLRHFVGVWEGDTAWGGTGKGLFARWLERTTGFYVSHLCRTKACHR